MLISAFLIFLVISTLYKDNSIMLNRLGVISLILILTIYITSIDIIGVSNDITLYNNWFIYNKKTIPTTIILLLGIIWILIYSTSKSRYDINRPYYIVILLCNIIGLVLLPLVNDIIVLYIIIELQSYSLYILTGLHNRSYNASRAGLLYFIMGGVASTIILLGSYFLYYELGTTNLLDIKLLYNYNNNINYYIDIIIIALLFKMGLAPLHRWSIATYNYAPTYITVYISIVAKISIITFIYINSYLINNYILFIFYYFSLFIGSYKPLFNINIKTILAYSGILNFGYILLSIITNDISFYIYIIQYVITHILLFLVILANNNYINNPISKWSPLIYINQLVMPNKLLAYIMILCLFSLIGMPPLPGFYGKYYIIITAMGNNYILEAIILIICSTISIYYYGNIIKILIYSKNNYKIYNNSINPSLAYIISLLTILVLTYYWLIPVMSEGLYLLLI